jgi:hypothetical protein
MNSADLYVIGGPQAFADLDPAAMSAAVKDPSNAKRGPKQPKRTSYRDSLADDTTDSESHNQSENSQPESQPDVIAAQPPRRTGRPRKSTSPVTVYDRDAGVGEVPANLRYPLV